MVDLERERSEALQNNLRAVKHWKLLADSWKLQKLQNKIYCKSFHEKLFYCTASDETPVLRAFRAIDKLLKIRKLRSELQKQQVSDNFNSET